MIWDLHTVRAILKTTFFPSQPRFICVKFKMASNLTKIYCFQLNEPLAVYSCYSQSKPVWMDMYIIIYMLNLTLNTFT